MTDILVSDPLRKSVEKASEGRSTVLYTSKGYPSYMTIIPAFNLEEVGDDLGTGRHPAFIVNGVEKNEIFIGTYQAIIHNDQAISLPYQRPRTSIDFHEAKAACTASGPGFHMMTNWEWAALALWCLKNGTLPRGNTGYGKSHSHPEEVGIRSGDYDITLTGSGPASWRHDGTMAGVADLVGNVWEWQDGLGLIDGKIIMPKDNSFELPASEWPETGACLNGVDEIQVSNTISKRGWISQWFKNIASKKKYHVPVALKQALIYPCDMVRKSEESQLGYVWANNSKDGVTRAALRGGYFLNGAYAGVFALNLVTAPSLSGYDIGFRACKVL